MSKINIPHIHKIEGEAGFWAKLAKTGQVEELKISTLTGLRQIEGILIGRKVGDIPLVVSRVCGICPVVHILNACCALEKALKIEVSDLTVLIRKILLASQIIHSHALHVFFMTLPDYLNLDNDLDLGKKFPEETKAALSVRDFATGIVEKIGGRTVHPLTPHIGGFLKMPDKAGLAEIVEGSKSALESALFLAEIFKKINYPELKRETLFASVFSKKDYPFYREDIVKIGEEEISAGDFYSNQIEESFKTPPVKKVEFRGKPYMLGAVSRIKNNKDFLNLKAKNVLADFEKQKRDIFSNVFFNLFSQVAEIVHFIEEVQKLGKETLNFDLQEKPKNTEVARGSGLSAMEAPRGTLFSYFEVDNGRISDCNIVTPTAQFLNNLEADLKVFLPAIADLPSEEKIKKIRSLIRVYDPCISCATH